MDTRNAIEMFLHFLKTQDSASNQTVRAYKSDLDQAFPKAILEVQNSQALLGSARLAQGSWSSLSMASRNRKTATLKSFFNWLYSQKYIDRPLAELLQSPKVPKKIPHFISVDEALSVIQFFQADFQNQKSARDQEQVQKSQSVFVLFCLLYGGGLRISEACQLKWEDVSLRTRSLRVLGKGQKERIVLIPEFCIQQLNTLKTYSESTAFVFGEKELNTRIGYEWIRQLGKKVGLMNSLHPHSLRHSFATHMLGSGANLRTLQKLLGHESLAATEKYTHLNVDQLARTMESNHPLSKSPIKQNE